MNVPHPELVIPLYLALINALTYFVFWYDKRAARLERRRIPEANLHLLSLLGGSPAALVAMKRLRHKTRKRSFLLRMYLVILTQIAYLLYIFR